MTAKRVTTFRNEKIGKEDVLAYTTESWICVLGLPLKKVKGYVLIMKVSK